MKPARLLPLTALTLLLAQCVQQPVPTGPAAGHYAHPYPQTAAVPPPVSAPAYPSAPAATAAAPTAPWQRTSALRHQPLPAGASLHEYSARSATETAEISVVIFDSRHCTLRLLDQPSPHAGGGVIAPLLRSAGAIAGVNAGFFHPDFSPLGLMIADGRKTGQFANTSLISGAVVLISSEPYLVWNREFLGESGVTQLVQAGPRLLDAGRPLPSLNRTKNATRTFIATDGKRLWAIGTARSTTLAGLADLLASPEMLPGLQVQRALNLDGGRSSALYIRKTDGSEITRPGWSTVRNYLSIVPR